MAASAPTYSLTLLQKIAWASNPLILSACAFFLYRRPDFRNFPGFFCYLLFVGLKSIALYFVFMRWGLSSYTAYYSSWGANVVSIGISFYVLYEVIRNVLTSGTVKLSRSNVLMMTAILVMIAAFLSLRVEANNDLLLMKIQLVAESLARYQQIGLLITLAVLTIFFGLYWGDLAFGISAGFGFYAAMQLVGVQIREHLGPSMNHAYNVANVWSYQMASLIWLFYILKKPKLPPKSLPSDKVSEYTEPIERMIR